MLWSNVCNVEPCVHIFNIESPLLKINFVHPYSACVVTQKKVPEQQKQKNPQTNIVRNC